MNRKPRNKLKKAVANLVMVGVAVSVGLLLCEWGARLIFNPADFLQFSLVSDKVLGAVPSSPPNGFDQWGFRNKTVPASVDIVAIGDSHTYGNTAKMGEAWPQVLGELTGRSVYNLGMGGYGPNQYYHLLKTKALTLKPRLVICGLYMGDDFENAYLISYGLDYWASLRKLPSVPVNYDIWHGSESTTWHKRIRVWLSRHSVLYQLVIHGPLLGRFQGDVQIQNASKLYKSNAAATVILPERNIREAFLPAGILKRLDQENEFIREGMRITFHILKEMNELCRTNGVEFVVAIIPSKEMVFADYLEHNPKIQSGDLFDKLLANERKAREATFAALAESAVRYVDVLPKLRASVERELYAHTAADMHPGRNGYRVIAEAISSDVMGTDRRK